MFEKKRFVISQCDEQTMMSVESNNRNCKAISKCVSLCLASCSFVQTDKEKKNKSRTKIDQRHKDFLPRILSSRSLNSGIKTDLALPATF